MNKPLELSEFDKGDLKVVGTRPVRPDGADKVTGKAQYGSDYYLPGQLYGAIKRSPHAHAKILSIDTSKAEALPGVKAVATHADFPDDLGGGAEAGEALIVLDHAAQCCLARGKVLFDGQPVVAVAATSANIAAEALDLIDVKYEVLPHVTSIEAALAEDAPLVHEDNETRGLPEQPEKPTNVDAYMQMGKGDPDEALAKADVVVERRYTTQPVHQGYIEPQGCTVSVTADGQVQVWSSSQGAFMVRTVTAAVTGTSTANVRAFPLEIGGGFGGKTTVYLEPVAAVLSRKSGRPVKMTLSRDEVFRSTGPAPGVVIDLKMGATKDGKLVAAVLDMSYGVGAFSGAGFGPGLIHSIGSYNIENTRLTGRDVLTNMPSTFAYRAPSAPQSEFAVECAMDELAQKLGMDPLELREKNAVKTGDPMVVGKPYGPINYVDLLEEVKKHPHWSEPLGPNQGRGFASGWWVNAGGPSTAMVNVNDDGTVVVATGNPDIGGSRASMAMMAAETLGIPYESVRPIVADTASIGFNMLTGGSRTTFAVGKAVVASADDVVEKLKARAAQMWGVDEGDVEWKDGAAHCTSSNESPLTLAEIAKKADQTGGPISSEQSLNPADAAAGFAAHICDVEVDPETGHVTVLRYTAFQDCGRAIHPTYVEGQVQGGAVQGIGWALNEAYIFDKDGKMDNSGFLDYRMPVASDLPMIDAVLVERPYPHHPYGVKGVGEPPICPPLATVANAVSDATKRRMCDLPMSPDKVYSALQADG